MLNQAVSKQILTIIMFKKYEKIKGEKNEL